MQLFKSQSSGPRELKGSPDLSVKDAERDRPDYFVDRFRLELPNRGAEGLRLDRGESVETFFRCTAMAVVMACLSRAASARTISSCSSIVRWRDSGEASFPAI